MSLLGLKELMTLLFALSALSMLATGCVHQPTNEELSEDEIYNSEQAQAEKIKGQLAASANTVSSDARSNSRPLIRHTLRELVEYDTIKMLNLVHKEFNPRVGSDEAYFNRAALVLGQLVLAQPHFTEREAALQELKGRLEATDYLFIIPRTAEELITISESNNPADQASAIVALDNLVDEIKGMYKREKESQEDLKSILVRVRDARLKVSEEAQRYAHEQIASLVSPSEEADAVLKILDGQKG